MNLCQYSEIFGLPGKGVHSQRILGLASVDIFGTILFSYIFSILFSWSFKNTLIFLFLLGILLHKMFCVDTALNSVIVG